MGRQTPPGPERLPRLARLVCSAVAGRARPGHRTMAQNGQAVVLKVGVLKVGVIQSSALRDSVVFHLARARGAANVPCFLRTEFSYFTPEGMADQLWRRS